MNAITQFQPGQLAAAFQGMSTDNDLGAGIQGGFGHIGYKGKVWSIRYRGQELTLMRDDPADPGPRNSIEVVIVKAPKVISKIWYESGYVEGSNAAPDCFSTNGMNPDPGAAKKQATACAACPKNAWGSRITPEGKKGKACGDSKRIAVVPAADVDNEAFGGPMLLRVPAASLQDLAAFGDAMKKVGYPYQAIVTRIAFDTAQAYPKFVFTAVRPLTNEEAQKVVALQYDARVDRILADNEFEAAPAQLAPPVGVFEQPPQQAPAAAPAPAPVTAPVKQAQPQAPVTAPKAGGFGAAAPAAQPVAAAPVATKPAAGGFGAAATSAAAPQATGTTAPTNATAFEASLDDKLASLLG
jgi:hypothetical protein